MKTKTDIWPINWEKRQRSSPATPVISHWWLYAVSTMLNGTAYFIQWAKHQHRPCDFLGLINNPFWWKIWLSSCPRKYIFGVYFETFLPHSYIGKIIEQHETFFLCGSRCLMHEISNPLWFRSNFKIRLKVRESEREMTNKTIILTKGAFQYSKNPRIRT